MALKAGDVVWHSSFGVGVVTGPRLDKSTVMFKTVRRLVLNSHLADVPASAPSWSLQPCSSTVH
jgi:hypothetical protein